jgi:hypothetical protein
METTVPRSCAGVGSGNISHSFTCFDLGTGRLEAMLLTLGEDLLGIESSYWRVP